MLLGTGREEEVDDDDEEEVVVVSFVTPKVYMGVNPGNEKRTASSTKHTVGSSTASSVTEHHYCRGEVCVGGGGGGKREMRGHNTRVRWEINFCTQAQMVNREGQLG